MTTSRRRRGQSVIDQMLARVKPEHITSANLSETERALFRAVMSEQTGNPDVWIPPHWRKNDGRPKRRRST